MRGSEVARSFLYWSISDRDNQANLLCFQEEEKKFISTLAENSSATEEELLQTIKSSAAGETRQEKPQGH